MWIWFLRLLHCCQKATEQKCSIGVCIYKSFNLLVKQFVDHSLSPALKF